MLESVLLTEASKNGSLDILLISSILRRIEIEIPPPK